MAVRLTAHDFPSGTPLNHFFLWNEQRRRHRRDWRYRLLRDPRRAPAVVRDAIAAAVRNADVAAHAAVFAVCETLRAPAVPTDTPRHILVIRLSAFGDFIQTLGPFAAIRRHHAGDRITLLTTKPYAVFAAELGYFDDIVIDERPASLDLAGWLRLRRVLRAGRFDRVYDLQTSQRSNLYAWLMRPGMPEWSGIAWACSHPHANLDRDAQHAIDEQAEQLLMAGIYPTPPIPALPPLCRALPDPLAGGREFALLVPGASPQHPAKRWPVERFAAVARSLDAAGVQPVVVGSAAEAPLGRAIRDACPAALDLVGKTADIALLAVLAQHARLTMGNDSGVCHLAAAAGCPVIVLFSRETDPARHAPRGRCVRILAEPDLNDLPVDRVVSAAMTILARAADPLCAPAPTGSAANAGVDR